MLEMLHDLHHQFPQDRDILQRLEIEDPYFRNLAGRYDEVDQAIHRIETEEESAGDGRIAHLRELRLRMLDEVAAIIRLRRAVA